MTPAEKLDTCEATIEQSVVDAVSAFKIVHDEQLYLCRHPDYESWLWDRFAIGSNYIRTLLECRLPARLQQLTLWDAAAANAMPAMLGVGTSGEGRSLDELIEETGGDRFKLAELARQQEAELIAAEEESQRQRIAEDALQRAFQEVNRSRQALRLNLMNRAPEADRERWHYPMLRAAKKRAMGLGWQDDGKDASILPREEGKQDGGATIDSPAVP